VLDKLPGGVPKVKVWEVSGSNCTPKGGFGSSSTISGMPLRIEGSVFEGHIVVLHGASPPQMISVFTPPEMPQ